MDFSLLFLFCWMAVGVPLRVPPFSLDATALEATQEVCSNQKMISATERLEWCHFMDDCKLRQDCPTCTALRDEEGAILIPARPRTGEIESDDAREFRLSQTSQGRQATGACCSHESSTSLSDVGMVASVSRCRCSELFWQCTRIVCCQF